MPEKITLPPLSELLETAPALTAGLRHSRALLLQLEKAFSGEPAWAGHFDCVFAAGSLGRLETHQASDLDVLWFAERPVEENLVRQLFALIERCGLRAPKADGIFRAGLAPGALLYPGDRGSLEESPQVFGKRLQLLLDARPLLNLPRCRQLQREVLTWYAGDTIDRHPDAQWTLLLNDLARYLHAYAGWQQYKFTHSTDDSWALRQVKLRSSRIVTFAGLMCLLGASSRRRGDKLPWLMEHLALTPLERIACVMRPVDAAAWERVLRSYEAMQALLARPEVRAALVATTADEAHTGETEGSVRFLELHAEGSLLMTTLSQFLLARAADWHPAFFNYLLL